LISSLLFASIFSSVTQDNLTVPKPFNKVSVDSTCVSRLLVGFETTEIFLDAGQGASHPVTHQPVLEVLPLADLNRSNGSVDKSTHRQ